MSYLILILSFVYASWALACAVVQVLIALIEGFKTGVTKFSFKSAIRYGVISFALACLSVYVNHWPKL